MIPAATRQWIAECWPTAQHGMEHFRRQLIIRWMLWQDGVMENAIPGYDTPPPDCGRGYPAGWSSGSFARIVCQAKQSEIRQALARPATQTTNPQY